jgi:iron complex transport system ATP-binding protein
MSLVTATGLAVSFGAHRVLDDVDLSLDAGGVLGLIGPNAAGKTTLIRVLAGLLTPANGDVSVLGQPIRSIPTGEHARLVAYLEQGAVSHWPLTVDRLVTLGRLPHLSPWRGLAPADHDAIARAMDEADIAHLSGRPVTTLSGGERARVMLARALAAEPELLLADEPVAQLDPYHQIGVMELLRRLAGRGGGVVVVLHDLTLAARFCDRLILLSRGRVTADGPPERVLTKENLERVYGVTAELVHRDGELFVIPHRRIEGRMGGATP